MNVMHDLGSFFRRNSTTAALTVIALCVLGIFCLQAVTINRLTDEVAAQNSVLVQTKHITEQLAGNAANRTRQINNLSDHIDCIVKFFSQRDRTRKIVDNINTCHLKTVPVTSQSSPTSNTTTLPQKSSSENVTTPAKKSLGVTKSSSTPKPPKKHTQPTQPPQPGFFERNLDKLSNFLGGLL